jgi:branched-chain amino acid transport system permease protein
MLYRENGQFKTSYAADQQIFPIAQDRWAILGLLLLAFIGVPLLVDEYLFRAILIPFLILSLAALGVNILVGFCGQITLGAGAFMAVGAYAAYNFHIRIEGMPLLGSFLLGGFTAAVVGIFFGIPSLRVRGLYLAVATLAAQFFTDWVFLRVPWFTDNASSGSVSVSNLQILHWQIVTPVDKYLFCLSFVTVFALLAKNMTRCAVGRQWMAIRDMDVAAEVIGIRPLFAKLSAFAVSSFFVGTAGALWGFIHLSSWEPAAFSVDLTALMRESARRTPSANSISGIEMSPTISIDISSGGHTSIPRKPTARPAIVARMEGERHTVVSLVWWSSSQAP